MREMQNAKCRVQNAELGLRRGKTTHAVIPTKRSAWRDLLGYFAHFGIESAQICDSLRAAFGGCSLARRCGASLDFAMKF